MDVTIADIEKYFEDVKEAINAGRYGVENSKNRQDNQDLLSEEKINTILTLLRKLFHHQIIW